jgi:hypothetical protein
MTVVTTVLALAAGSGCEDKSGEPQFKPQSVPEDKPVDELDPMEQMDFCDEATQWAKAFLEDDLPRLLCRFDAIEAGTTADGTFDVQACRAAEQECLANPPTDDVDTNNLDCDFENLDPSCDVTVGEFATCFEEAAKLTDRLVAAISCEKIASGDIPDESQFQLSPTCQSVLDRCGGASSSDESGGGSETGTLPPE